MTEFAAAPLDRAARVTTVVALVVVLGAAAVIGLATEEPAGRLVGVGLGPLIALLAWGYSPASFLLTGRTVEVRRRLFGRKRFVTGGVLRPDWRVGPAWVRTLGSGLTVRKLGSGGLFGWYGSFWRAGVGSFHAYVTDRSRAVLCETDGGPLVVSPADPDGFVAALAQVGP